MNDQYIQAITSSSVFQGRTPHGAQVLLDRGEVKEHNAGELIFAEGDSSTFVLLILSGRLQVFVSREGRDITLTEPGPGLVVGELGVLCGVPRTASVRAREASAVLHWSDTAFRGLLFGDAHLSQRIFSQLLRTLIENERSLIESLIRAQGTKG